MISSFLDFEPEDDLVEINSGPSICYQGMIPRGPFDRPLDFLELVPANERHAVYAYLNNRDIQQQPEPRAQCVIIDVYDALAAAGLAQAPASEQERWLKANLPFLYRELATTVKPERLALPGTSPNLPHKERWWLFGSVREGLRAARSQHAPNILLGATGKSIVPVLLPRTATACDETTAHISSALFTLVTHSFFVVPSQSRAVVALLSSKLFETFTRRNCSSLGTGLRFTPTQVFPYFPFPWEGQPTGNDAIAPELNPPKAVEQRLKKPAQALLDLRHSLLTQPERYGLRQRAFRGPTDLYNAFDDPTCSVPGIQALRQAHVEVENLVLAEYGWSDLALESWTFERPWIDGTIRYVPPVGVRREYLVRLRELNHSKASRC